LVRQKDSGTRFRELQREEAGEERKKNPQRVKVLWRRGWYYAGEGEKRGHRSLGRVRSYQDPTQKRVEGVKGVVGE